jgi:hypothetical protein
MGNTILAHALFACGQVDLDLDKFFSATGNSHAIGPLNRTVLTAEHMIECPDPSLVCVLEITCADWWEVLRIKMSYSKWMLETPDLNNFSKFYSYRSDQAAETKLWQDFYQTVKDPSWPSCNCPEDIKTLPSAIQDEINQLYSVPRLQEPDTPARLVEWLSGIYYNIFLNPIRYHKRSPNLGLGQYIEGDYAQLINICNNLGWDWDHAKGNQFYKKMININGQYLAWLEKIKTTVNLVVDKKAVVDTFDLWEQALIIAKACQAVAQHPSTLKWDTDSCNAVENNVYLDKFTRTHHGKTIRHFKVPQGNYQKY